MLTSWKRALIILVWLLALLFSIGAAVLTVGGYLPAAQSQLDSLLAGLFPFVFATVGMLLLFHRPGNVIGWIYLAGGSVGALSVLAGVYQNASVAQDWAGTLLAGVVSQFTYFPFIIALLALPLLLYPDGHLPSSRWRWALWVTGAAIAVMAVGNGLAPEIEIEGGTGPNPIGIGIFGSLWILAPGMALFITSLVASTVAMVVRFRRSTGVERLQLKWFVYMASVAGTGFVAVVVMNLIAPETLERLGIVGYATLLGAWGIPIATGLAIVQYRLYDIDRLISRTITYGLLVGLLAAVYATAVFAVGILPFDSSVGVALATLVVAALFNPLRGILKTAIDRRFSRSGYDARSVLDDFATRVSDQVDVESLVKGLLEVVDDTVVPSGAAVWVRDPNPG